MADDEAPSPWGGVILVMLGVAMVLVPIATIFTGVAIFRSYAPIYQSERQDISGLVLLFIFGPLVVSVGVAELRKAPPQYRLRTLFIVMTMVATVLGLVYLARN